MNGHSSKFDVTNEPLAAYPNHQSKANPRIECIKQTHRTWLLFGIAPGGACHAVHVTMNPVGPYPTFSPLPKKCPQAVFFLWRFPSGCPARALPGTVALWSPDFPRSKLTPRPFSLPHTNLCKFWLVIGQYLFTIFLPPVEKAWGPIYKQTHHRQDRFRTGLFLDLQ